MSLLLICIWHAAWQFAHSAIQLARHFCNDNLPVFLAFLVSQIAFDAGIASGGYIADHLRSCGTSLASALQALPLLARCCTLSGILSVMPVEAFSTAFELSGQSAQESAEASASSERANHWNLLIDGALPAACSLVASPCDPEIKFYALGALTVTLQSIYRHMQVSFLTMKAAFICKVAKRDKCLCL